MKRVSAQIVGAAVLVAGLAFAQPAQAGNGRSALARLPADTAMVLTVNVDRAKRSGMFKDVLAMAQKNVDTAKGLDLLKAQAQFDIAKDLKTVVIGFDKDFQTNEHAVLVIEGNFNAKKIMAFAKKSAKVVDAKHAGVRYYKVDKDAELMFGKGYVIMTKGGHMDRVIDAQKHHKNITSNKAFMRHYKGADTGKDFWFVGLIPPKAKNQMMGMSLDAIVASIDIAKGLVAKIRLAAADAATAQSMATMMQAGLAQSSNDQTVKTLGLENALKKVTIQANAANVDVGVSLTDAELATIKNLIKTFM